MGGAKDRWGWPVSRVADVLRISRATVHRWADGEEGKPPLLAVRRIPPDREGAERRFDPAEVIRLLAQIQPDEDILAVIGREFPGKDAAAVYEEIFGPPAAGELPRAA